VMTDSDATPQSYDSTYKDISTMRTFLDSLIGYLDVLGDKDSSQLEIREVELSIRQCAEGLSALWRDLDTRLSILGVSALIEHARERGGA
jgi:hypothetical protein